MSGLSLVVTAAIIFAVVQLLAVRCSASMIIPNNQRLKKGTAASEQYPLVFLDDPDAVCIDGSKAGYYIRRSKNSTDKWMLYLGGGAWCWSAENCFARSSTSYGSSTRWDRHISANDFGGGPLSPNCTINPTFCNFTLVLINYCDGNSFAGMLREPLVFNNTKLHLKGKFILDALIERLLTKEGLHNASQFLLTGGSAGGLAVYLHSDAIRDRLVASVPGLKKFGAIPISGFFLDEPNIAFAPMYQDHIKGAFMISNATHGLPSKCIEGTAAADLWRCNFAEYVYPLSNVPTFVMNSKTDFWQVTCILNLMPLLNYGKASFNDVINGNCSSVPGYGCINWGGYDKCSPQEIQPAFAYQNAFLERVYAIPNFFRKGNGAYITSCYTHCEGQDDHVYETLLVQNTSMPAAVERWWIGLGNRTHLQEAEPNLTPFRAGAGAPSADVYIDCQWHDPSPYKCNPLCPA